MNFSHDESYTDDILNILVDKPLQQPSESTTCTYKNIGIPLEHHCIMGSLETAFAAGGGGEPSSPCLVLGDTLDQNEEPVQIHSSPISTSKNAQNERGVWNALVSLLIIKLLFLAH